MLYAVGSQNNKQLTDLIHELVPLLNERYPAQRGNLQQMALVGFGKSHGNERAYLADEDDRGRSRFTPESAQKPPLEERNVC